MMDEIKRMVEDPASPIIKLAARVATRCREGMSEDPFKAADDAWYLAERLQSLADYLREASNRGNRGPR